MDILQLTMTYICKLKSLISLQINLTESAWYWPVGSISRSSCLISPFRLGRFSNDRKKPIPKFTYHNRSKQRDEPIRILRWKSFVQGAIGFGFPPHGLKNWHIFMLITKHSNRNRVVTSDSHWKLLYLSKNQEITTLIPLGLITSSLKNPTLNKVESHAFSSALLTFILSSA